MSNVIVRVDIIKKHGSITSLQKGVNWEIPMYIKEVAMPFLVIVVIIAVWAFVFTKKNLNPTLAISLVAVVTLAGCVWLVTDFYGLESRVILVNDKESIGDDGTYRVYTDGDTLIIKDIRADVSNWRTDSADFYGSIERGACYEVDVQGWEFGLLSMMPNIVNADYLGSAEVCSSSSSNTG